MLYNEHKLLHKDARTSLTRYVSSLSEKNIVSTVEKIWLLSFGSFDARISDSAILQARVHISVIPQNLPQACCVNCQNCMLCLLLSTLLLQEAFPDSPQVWIRRPPTPTPSVSPSQHLPHSVKVCLLTLCFSFISYMRVEILFVFLTLDPWGTAWCLGHSRCSVNKNRWNAVE